MYDGKWFSQSREALDAFVQSTQEAVSGTVKLKLYKGNIVPAAINSDASLYDHDLASFSDTDLYDQKDAKGFIKVFGLPLKIQGMVKRKRGNDV